MKTQIFFIALSFLTLSLNAANADEVKPSFDCAKAQTEVEKMICADKSGRLQSFDKEMAEDYSKLKAKLDAQSEEELLLNQRTWLKEFQKCDSKVCVENALNQRIGYLEVLDMEGLSFFSDFWEGNYSSTSYKDKNLFTRYIKIQSCSFDSCDFTYNFVATGAMSKCNIEGKMELLNANNAIITPKNPSYKDCKINILSDIRTISITRDEKTFANECYAICDNNVAIFQTYKKELPSFIQDWQGIYTKNIQGKNLSFQISDNCWADNKRVMGNFVCEIGYSENGSEFDDWNFNFYTEKPNDMDYGVVRIIELKSEKEAVIKVFSMEYSNDFCDVDVKKEGDTITLKSSECKIDDFVLHKNIFGEYQKQAKTK